MTHDEERYPRWGDIEHNQTDIQLVMSVSDALRLRSELPALVRQLATHEARSPEGREHRREASAAVDRLVAQLREQLRPFGSPQPAEATDEEGV
jgi:hypothetical protein